MPRRGRSRRARSSGVEEPREPRSYSVWGFVALFVLLGVGGLLYLLYGPPPDEGSRRLAVPQTLPETTAPGSGDATSGPANDTPADTSATTPTFPDGSPAPDGVVDVVVEGDTLSLLFAVPDAPDGDEPAGDANARTAPLSITPVGEDEITIRVDCADSADEVIAQVTVTESPTEVTVAAAKLIPPDGPPCAPDTSPSIVTVPLRSPLDGRTLSAVPAGVDLSDLPTAG